MRALLCHRFGEPEDLELADVPSAPLQPGQVRIQVAAAPITHFCLLRMRGNAQWSTPFPYTLGAECTGVITEVATDVINLKVGQRVMGLPGGMYGIGGIQEECALPADDVYPIPDSMDFVTAAGFANTYGTAYASLVNRIALKAGEWLLVLGAGGGVGLAAVGIGRAVGARVIAAASSAEKLEAAKAAGAEYGINYSEQDLRDAVRSIVGEGVDAVLDPVGGDRFNQAIRCLKKGGRVNIVGFAGGDIQSIRANYLLVKNIVVYGGSGERSQSRSQMREQYAQLTQWYERGYLSPRVSRCLPVEQFVTAFKLLDQREAIGRIVLAF